MLIAEIKYIQIHDPKGDKIQNLPCNETHDTEILQLSILITFGIWILVISNIPSVYLLTMKSTLLVQ